MSTPVDSESSSAWHWWLPGIVMVMAILAGFGPLLRLDLLAYDLTAALLPNRYVEPPPVIVAIDERSLGKLGPWPWPREIHARLLEKTLAAPPRAVAFCLLFDQADGAGESNDIRFAEALKHSGRGILAVAPIADEDGFGMRTATPRPILVANAADLGHVDVEIDPDGKLRRIYLRAGMGHGHWPALAQAMAEFQAVDKPMPTPGLRADHVGDAGPSTWRRDYEVLLHLDPLRRVERIAYADVLDDARVAARLKNRAVFVGVTASGLGAGFSLAATPRGTLSPAVEYHARAYEALRSNDLITPLNGPTIAFISLLTIVLGAVTHRRYRASPVSLSLLVVGLPVLLSLALLLVGRYWYPPVGATLALVTSYLLWAGQRFRLTWVDAYLTRRRDSATLDAVADAVIAIDGEGRVDYINPAGEALFGHSARALVGRPIETLTEDLESEHDDWRSLLRGPTSSRREILRVAEPMRLRHKPGRMVRLVASPIEDAGAHAAGWVLAFSDISEVVAANHRLHHQATHDTLTDLPNRLLLRDRIERGIVGARRSGGSLGVVFIDLDDFKRINDSFGHQTGDRVLRDVATRLKAACRATDTVGRWGGDEFVIVLAELMPQESMDGIIRKLLTALAEPIVIDSHRFHVSATMGVSRAPDDSVDPDVLLNLADSAMYRVKNQGGNSFGYASADMARLSRERLELETALRDALRNGELVMHYQPQVRISTGATIGMEALIRWRRPGFGLIPPNGFIPLAEETNLIFEIGAWVIDEVAGQLRRWIDEGLAVVPVAINVSAKQCADASLVSRLSEAIARHAIDPRLIEIEITETTAMKNIDHVEALLDELQAIGVGVALDDFGTGYSSLVHLKRLPISVLKIDQSFIRGVSDNGDDAAITRAMIALAHQIGLKVIGEGVETNDQSDFLSAQACDIAQGYYFARPEAASDARARLTRAEPPVTSPGAVAPDLPALP